MGKRKKKNDDLILGIAIGAVATYAVLNGMACAGNPPVRVIVPPTRPPATHLPPATIRQIPRAARVADFFRMRPRGYGTLGVYHSI